MLSVAPAVSTSPIAAGTNDGRIPTQTENDALVGTNGTPSTSNPYVTTTDPRIPSTGENDALVGTQGTPSATNLYVTTQDTRFYTLPRNRQTVAAYTLLLTDQGGSVEMNNASANTVTVPANANVAFAIGTVITVGQYGAGKTTVAAAAGVTIRSAGSLLGLRAQYSQVTLQKIGTDEWWLAGDTG
jgi:hypothetical protein